MLWSRESLGLVLGLTALVAATGCEAQKCETDEGESAVCLKSLKRFELDGGEIRPNALTYVSGINVTVRGNYGDIDVVEGYAEEVGVVLEPFNYRAHDAEDAARDELENKFDYSFEYDEDAAEMVLTTGRHDSNTGLGADITVYLPPEFDGVLSVYNDSDGPVDPGDIDVSFVGQAVSVDVSTDSLGDCNVDGEGSVTFTKARCDGVITVSGVSSEVDIASTGLSGDIDVSLADIGADSGGGSIKSEDGDIEVSFPGGAEFTVQASSSADGTVSATALDDACTGDSAGATAKSYTCGDGGPNYVVTAGTDSTGPSSVTLKY